MGSRPAETDSSLDAVNELQAVVRDALDGRLPASAFTTRDGRQWVQVGSHRIDYDALCAVVAADVWDAMGEGE